MKCDQDHNISCNWSDGKKCVDHSKADYLFIETLRELFGTVNVREGWQGLHRSSPFFFFFSGCNMSC